MKFLDETRAFEKKVVSYCILPSAFTFLIVLWRFSFCFSFHVSHFALCVHVSHFAFTFHVSHFAFVNVSDLILLVMAFRARIGAGSLPPYCGRFGGLILLRASRSLSQLLLLVFFLVFLLLFLLI